MNQQILDLIEMAVADGEVSEKERGVILRKADSLGEDRDEVEMILDSKLRKSKPTTEKAGNLIKCPSCNASIPSFTTKCEYCGHEFRNVEKSKNVRELLDELLAIDQSKTMFRSGGMFDMSAKADNDKMAKEAANQKAMIINLFPVPNSKEDILEFLSIAVPYAKNVKTGIAKFFTLESSTGDNQAHYNQIINVAWKSKCEQIIMKARFSMKSDAKTLDEINFYAKELKLK